MSWTAETIFYFICLVAACLVYIWKMPHRQVAQAKKEDIKDRISRAELLIEYRKQWIQMVGGGFVLAGLAVSATQVYGDLDLRNRGHLTETFARAAEMLDRESESTQVGAVNVLSQIAADAEAFHWPAMDVIMTELRNERLWEGALTQKRPSAPETGPLYTEEPDWTASAATAFRALAYREIGDAEERLRRENPVYSQVLKLGRLDLRCIRIPNARLSGVRAWSSNLSWVDAEAADWRYADLTQAALVGTFMCNVIAEQISLFKADCRYAYFTGADLRGVNGAGADFRQADLRNANLSNGVLRWCLLQGARLDGADLRGAKLWQADVSGATMDNTHLCGAQMTELTHGLSKEQLMGALLDSETTLPEWALQDADIRERVGSGKCRHRKDEKVIDPFGVRLEWEKFRSTTRRGAEWSDR